MTTLDELCAVLDDLDIPWTNTAWERADDAEAPFIVLAKTGGSTFGANNMSWCSVAEYDIELYTERRDYATEKTITDALDDAGIYWDDGGVWWIDDEGIMEAVFTVSVIEN